KLYNITMKPILQSRWKVCGGRLVYYGIRKSPFTFKNSIKVSKTEIKVLGELDGTRTLEEYSKKRIIKKFIRKGVVVDASENIVLPKSLAAARYCKKCVANDFTVPGIEFDKDGLCPMCASRINFSSRRAIMPVKTEIPYNKKGKYDVALFYTGGKDSSYLLYYLAAVKKLRVLAMTWQIPFMSKNALQSIENAKEKLKNVTFVSRKASDEATEAIYAEHYRLAGNTCMCPSFAYVLFYPLLVEERVPYVVLGNEPVQMQNLIFNNISPSFAFIPALQGLARFGVNILRILTFRKPFKCGQMQMYFTVKALSDGKIPFKDSGKYHNEQVANVCKALNSQPEFMEPFKKCVDKSVKRGFIPQLVHIDFDETLGGVYNWQQVKELLKEQIGWTDCEEKDKALHTSCVIEKCKEYTQLKRFKDMQGRTIPYSAIELSLAVSSGCISREEAMEELKNSCGFCGCQSEMQVMLSSFKQN
ncbi:MAG: hypothetical protein LUD27_01140, partial [Clostridia bacterium]|nr:hypothetical protein [Clostridia bacterium]